MITEDQITQIIGELTVGDRKAAKAAGATDPEDMTFFMLHRRAVAMGAFEGDLDAFLDNIKVSDIKAAQRKSDAETAPLDSAPKAQG